jgi:AcrR family transcriptional regulator
MAKNAAMVSKKERILDAAEQLFAQRGYDGVTLRQIAARAGVDVALANYHIGNKRELFETVFVRRAELLNKSRAEALSMCERTAGTAGPSVEQIIEAFLRPLEMAQETGDEGWQNYLALVAYVNNSPVWGKQMMSKYFDKLIKRFIKALKKSLPGATDKQLFWCYNYLSGALTLTFAQTGRIDKLSRGVCKSSDFQSAYDHMIPFIAGGFRQVCGARNL